MNGAPPFAQLDLGSFESWLVSLAIVATACLVGYAVRLIVVPRLARISSRTATDLDDLLLASVKKHVPFWFFLAGVVLAVHWAPIEERYVSLTRHVCAALFFLSLSIAAASLVGGLVTRAARGAEGSFATTSLAHNVLRAMVLGIGALLVLVNLGIEITPLLTALGVGSLAVALALQPTLSNLFAGLHISIAKPMRIGDFIELESGAQGTVQDIGWRATELREPANNVIIVPNARLVEMVLKNYALPLPEQGIGVSLGVGYGSDLEHVERVTLEVAREVLASCVGAVPGFEPAVRFTSFGDSAITLSVALRVRHVNDRPLVVHEFIKTLKARYDREGIDIPFPQRVVHSAPGAPRPLAVAGVGGPTDPGRA
jgi:small-conductance mechanosensitive channel